MLINCANCQRSFDVDDAKATEAGRALCACGATLTLRPRAGVSQIGRYTLLHQIAIGGMGEIWFALQQGSDGFEKEVVVKRLLPNYAADREVTAMLIKEAKMSSRLKHSNIVEVYDLVHLGGNYLIVMEYVPGITVRDLVNACCDADVVPPWQLAVHIVLQLLRGLGYAHHLPQRDGTFATVIHRDISPQNLLICGDATVKVTDFGIAKAINEASNTAPGLIRGKASYLTPERVRGGDMNEMSDLFPAAIILFEIWTLTSLFRGENHEETLRKLFAAQVPPITNFRQDVSPALEAVMRRALDRRVAERYPDAQAFEAALVEACAPVTTQQIQAAAAAFLSAHKAFFASVASHRSGGGASETEEVEKTTPNPPSVQTLLRAKGAPARPGAADAATTSPARRAFAWWQPVAAVGLFVLGFGAASLPGWRGQQRTRVQAVAETAATSAVASAAPDPGGASPTAPGATTPTVAPPASPPQTPANPALHENPAELPVAAAVPGPAPVPAASAPPAEAPGAAEAEAPEAPGGEAGETNDNAHTSPTAPSRNELHAFFRKYASRLRACVQGSALGPVTRLTVKIDPSGRVSADPGDAGLSESGADCLADVIAHLRFRSFAGAPVTYPLAIRTSNGAP